VGPSPCHPSGSFPMAEIAASSITSLDALFQFLTCVRDVPPVLVRHQILVALQADKLKVDFQVRDGPGGPVHWQAWERDFTLSIQDGHLVVEPRCALDHAWDAYSFTIANGSVIGALWPAQGQAFDPPSSEPPLHPLQESTFVLSGLDFAQPELQTRRKPTPKEWFEEPHAKYAHRLYEFMQAAHTAKTVTTVWAETTLLRRLFKGD
jgi:hypothetical protein